MLEPNKSGQAEAAMVMPVSLPAKLWVFPQEVEPSADLLASCGGSATLARVLIRRGLTTAAAVRQFLNESEYVATAPYELPGVEKAVGGVVEQGLDIVGTAGQVVNVTAYGGEEALGAEGLEPGVCVPETVHRSADGTRKIAVRLRDGALIETVLLPSVSGRGSSTAWLTNLRSKRER